MILVVIQCSILHEDLQYLYKIEIKIGRYRIIFIKIKFIM